MAPSFSNFRSAIQYIIDLIAAMNDSNEQANILVSVSMRSERDGGRHGPFTEGYSPHLIVSGGTEWLGVRAVQCPGPIAPGDAGDVVFALMYHPQLDYSALQVGVQFSIREGAKIVGVGEVLERFEKIKHQSAA